MSAPLDGIKIVDMSSVIMGPYATQILADLGADVIKVEALSGDTMRAVGPMVNPGMGCLFLHANRNKKSVAINLKAPEGLEAMKALVAEADIVISNIRSQAMARLGLSYQDVKAVKDDIIYIEAYGFGAQGTYNGKPAYDDMIQGLAGLPALSLLAGSDQPKYTPTLIADRIVGLHIVNNALAAVLHRNRTGQGQQIEVPMFETLAHMILGDHMGGATFMPQTEPMGYMRLLSEHRQPYPTADGYICAVVYTDAHWKSFLTLTNDQHLLEEDDRFSSLRKRSEHIGELYALVAKRLKERTTAQWLELLAQADIPAMPMHTLESLVQDEHLQSVQFFYEEEHPTEGRLRQIRYPANWSTAKLEQNTPAPRLGEHTVSTLESAGFSSQHIEQLLAKNVIFQS